MRIWFSLWLLERLKKVAPKKGLVTEPDLVPCLPQTGQSWRPSSLDFLYEEVSLLNSSPHCFVLIFSCSALCFSTSHFDIVIIFLVPFSFTPCLHMTSTVDCKLLDTGAIYAISTALGECELPRWYSIGASVYSYLIFEKVI